MNRRVQNALIALAYLLFAGAANARAPNRGFHFAHQTSEEVTVEVGPGLAIETLVKAFAPLFEKATDRELTWRDIAEANLGNVIPACRLANGQATFHMDRSTAAWDTCPVPNQTAILIAGSFTRIHLKARASLTDQMADLSRAKALAEEKLDATIDCFGAPTSDCLTNLIHEAKGEIPAEMFFPKASPPVIQVVTKAYTSPFAKFSFGFGIASSACCLIALVFLALERNTRVTESASITSILTSVHPEMQSLPPFEGIKKLVSDWGSFELRKHTAIRDATDRLEEELASVKLRAEEERVRRMDLLKSMSFMATSIVSVAKTWGFIPMPDVALPPEERSNDLVLKAFAFIRTMPDRFERTLRDRIAIEREKSVEDRHVLEERGVFVERLEAIFRKHIGPLCERLGQDPNELTIEAIDRMGGMSGVFQLYEERIVVLERERDDLDARIAAMVSVPTRRYGLSQRSATPDPHDVHAVLSPSIMNRFLSHLHVFENVTDPLVIRTLKDAVALAAFANHPVEFDDKLFRSPDESGENLKDWAVPEHLRMALRDARVSTVPNLVKILFPQAVSLPA